MSPDLKKWQSRISLLRAAASGDAVVIRRNERDCGKYYLKDELEAVSPGVLSRIVEAGGVVPDRGPGRYSVPRALRRIDRRNKGGK